MTVRRLPPEEYHKLAELPIATNGIPDPNICVVIVVEDQDKIVGTWAFMPVPILDGLWVDEAYRKTSAAPKLLHGMKQMLREQGIPQVFTLVQTPEVMILAHKGGFKRVQGDLMSLIQLPDGTEI